MSYFLTPTSQKLFCEASGNPESIDSILSPQPIPRPMIEADRFLKTLYDRDYIDQKGWLKDSISLPPIPILGRGSMKRLDSLLEQTIKINESDLHRVISYKDLLLKLDLDKGRIYLVGGMVPWILGAEGIFEAGSALLGEENFRHIFNEGSLARFDNKKGDLDIRYKIANDTDPHFVAEQLLRRLAKEFQPSKYKEEEICNVLRTTGGPFEKFEPFFDVDDVVVDGKGVRKRHAFRINYKDSDGSELDVLIASVLQNDTLLTLQDLTLDITDYLRGSTTQLRPEGKSFNGWQAIAAHLGKLIQLQSINPQAWARAQAKKVFGYRMLEPYPDELYAKINPYALGAILHGIVENHIGGNPAAGVMLLLDSTSNLVQRGFHHSEVDQIVQQNPIERILPNELHAINKASNIIPMELILAVLRLAKHKAEDPLSNHPDSFLTWRIEGCEATIQMTLERAIELIVFYEMQRKVSQKDESLKCLIHLFDTLHGNNKEKEGVSGPLIALDIAAIACPQFLKRACELYFKDREGDTTLALTLVKCLIPRNWQAASQFFWRHLTHVDKIELSQIEQFDHLCRQSFLSDNNNQAIEAIHSLIPMAKKICQESPGFENQIATIIEGYLKIFLGKNRPRTGGYLLRFGMESGLKLDNGDLWLQCVEGIFTLSYPNAKQEAVNLWIFADRRSIRLNHVRSMDQLPFYLEFIEALYQQGTQEKEKQEYLRLGDSLQDWIPTVGKHNEFYSSIQSVSEKRKRNELELKISQKNIFSMFEFLERWKPEDAAHGIDTVKQRFVELMALVSKCDKSSWQSYVNKLQRLLPKFIPYFTDDLIVLQNSILDIIEAAFHADHQSSNLLEILTLVLREMPLAPRTVLLLTEGLKEGRFSLVSKEFKQVLCKLQKTIFEEFFRQQKHEEIILLIILIGQNADNLNNERKIYFEIWLNAFRTFIEKYKFEEKKGAHVSRPIFLCQPLLEKMYPKENEADPSEKELLVRLIDSMHEQGLIRESVFWIKCYFDSISLHPKEIIPDNVLKIFRWTETISQQGMLIEVAYCLKFIYKHFPEIHNKVFDFILRLPDEFLKVSTSSIAKMFQARIHVDKERIKDIHVRLKIRKLIRVLLETSHNQKKFAYALNFLELGFHDSLEVLHRVIEAGWSKPLKLSHRAWRLFRIRFQEFLADEATMRASSPTIVKCLKAGGPILKSVSKERFTPAIQDIDAIIDRYLDPRLPLEDWLQDPVKQLIIIEDIGSLLCTKFPKITMGVGISDVYKIHNLRKRLSKFPIGYNKDNPDHVVIKTLSEVIDQILSYQFIRINDPSLFIKGLFLLKISLERNQKLLANHIEIFLLALENSKEPAGLVKLAKEGVFFDVVKIIDQKQPSKHDVERIKQAMRSHPIVKEEGRTLYQQNLIRYIRSFSGADKTIDREKQLTKREIRQLQQIQRCSEKCLKVDTFLEGLRWSVRMVFLGCIMMILAQYIEDRRQ